MNNQTPRTLVFEPLEDRLLFSATPLVTIDMEPGGDVDTEANVMINEGFEFTVRFENDSNVPTEAGYGPYIGVKLEKGLDLLNGGKADYLGQDLTVAAHYEFDAAEVVPGQDYQEIDVHGQIIRLREGEEFYLYDMPFGSFVPNQQPIDLVFSAITDKLNEGAAVGEQLGISVIGGFKYGDTPTGNTPIHAVVAEGHVTPVVWEVTKTLVAPEHETATGPNYEREWVITIDVANGETIDNIRIEDLLPGNLQYTRYEIIGGTATSTLLPSTSTPGGAFEVEFDSITGTTSTSDVTIRYWTYVPEFEADGTTPVIDPITGDDVESENGVTATAEYHGEPIYDTVAAPGSLDNDATLDDKSIAIQKGATNITHSSSTGILPGDIIEYSLDYQISDYFTFDDIFVIDTLSDGQRFVPGTMPALVWQERGISGGTLQFGTTGTNIYSNGAFNVTQYENFVVLENLSGTDHTYDLGDVLGAGWLSDANLINDITVVSGDTKIVFFVSKLIDTAAEDGILVGGYVGGLAAGATRGVITYRSQVQEEYVNPATYYQDGAAIDPSIDLGDTIGNSVVINGRIIVNGTTDPTGERETDDSSAGLRVGGPELAKSIYAINKNTSYGVPAVSSGETITYRLNLTMPTSDVEHLKIKDFLPLPKFESTELIDVLVVKRSEFIDPSFDMASYMEGGKVIIVLDDTNVGGIAGNNVYDKVMLGGLRPDADLFSFDAASNSFEVNIGSFDLDGMSPTAIDVFFTVSTKDDAMVDGLLLTNQMVATYNNTGTAEVVDSKIVQVIIEEPVLTIRKGVVGANGLTAVVGDDVNPSNNITFGSGGFVKGGSDGINTTAEAIEIGSMNIGGLDAGDTVRFAIVVENTGRGDAYDIVITDTIPSHFENPTNLVVQLGDGSVLTENVDYTVTWNGNNFSIELIDPSVNQGAIGKGIESGTPNDPIADGTNFLVISYSAVLKGTIASGSSYTNVASIDQYHGMDNGNSNRVTGDNPNHQEDATVGTAGPVIVKTLTGTSVNETGNAALDEAVIGEIVTYTLQITISEGITHNVVLTDTLDAGLAFVGVSSLSYSSDLSPETVGLGNFTFTMNGQVMTFDFGDITNTNTNNAVDEVITIVYQAVVLNTTANNAGVELGNSVTLDYDVFSGIGDEPEVTSAASLNASADKVTIVEPELTITLAAATTQAGTYSDTVSTVDAGDDIFYRVVISNDGGPTAWDANLLAQLPAGTLVSGLQVVSVSTTGTVNYSAASLNDSFSVTGSTLNSVGKIDIGDNSTITIIVKGTLTTAVAPGQALTTAGGVDPTAKVTWTSLNGTPGAPLSSHNTVDSTERTGNDPDPLGAATALNDYHDRDATRVTIRVPENTKTVVATSESGTSGSNVTIGEIVRYELRVKIPEGTSPDLRIIDNLPAGIVFINDGTTTVFFETGAGNPLSSSLWGVQPNGSGNALNLGDAQITNLSGADAYGNGTDVVFSLGTVTNTDTNNAVNEYIVIQFNALVLNTSGNQSGTVLTNSFTTQVNRDGTHTQVGNQASATVTVLEPRLTVDKAHNIASGTRVKAGDEITYTITIENDGNAAAYDIRVRDIVDQIYANNSTVDIEITNVSVSGAPAGTSELSRTTTSAQLDMVFNRLLAGESITINIVATVKSTAQAGAEIENGVDVTYTSLPGSTGTKNTATGTDGSSVDYGTTPSTITSTIASAISGSGGQITSSTASERTGADLPGGGVNDYGTSDRATGILVATPTIDKVWKDGSISSDDTSVSTSTGNLVVIGETYTYDIIVTLPAGVTDALTVLDVIPSGATYVGATVTPGSHVDPTVSGIVPTVLPNGSLSFSFGNVSVTEGGVTADQQIVIRVTARVDNEIANQHATILSGIASLTYRDPDGSNNQANGQGSGYAGQVITVNDSNTANNPSFQVVEPRVGVTKSVTPANPSGPIDAGDLLNYSITLNNSSGQMAYDLVFRDEISQWLDLETSLGVPLHNLTATLNDGVGTTNISHLFEFADVSGTWVLRGIDDTYDLAAGSSITITFTAMVSPDVPTAVEIENTAFIGWSSLDGVSIHERDGSDIPKGDTPLSGNYHTTNPTQVGGVPQVDDYVVKSTVAITAINDINVTKGLASTSEPSTTGSNLAIGEVATYWIKVTIPEGVAGNLVLRDLLPAGMQYLPGTMTVVTDAAGAPVGFTVPVDFEDFNGTITGGATVNTSGNLITISFGEITVAADNDVDNNTFYLVYQARVQDVVGNNGKGVNPTQLTNTVSHNNGSGSVFSADPGNSTTVTVVEPDLEISKTVVVGGSGTSGDAGDTVVYTITISHSNLSRADAFDLAIRDLLPAGIVNWSITSATISDGAGGNADRNVIASLGWLTNELITLDNNASDSINLEYGTGGALGSEQLVIVISANISDTLAPGSADIVNVASVSYTTLPNDGAPGDDFAQQPGERITSISDDATITILSTLDLDKTINATSQVHTTGTNVTIGEVVTYQLAVTLQQGVTGTVVLRDTLPAGLNLVPGSLTFLGGTGVSAQGDASTYTNGIALQASDFTYNSVTGEIVITLSNVTIPATTVDGTGQFVIEYDARVMNVAGNQANLSGEPATPTRTNEASVEVRLNHDDTANTVVSDEVTVTIVEPRLTLDKTRTSVNSNADAGDTVTYTLVITNTGNSTAFNIAIADLLDSELQLNSFILTSGNGYNSLSFGPDHSTTEVDALLSELRAGDSVTLTLNARVIDGANPGDIISNTASITYTGIQAGDPDAGSGRNGSGTGPNDYHAEDSATEFELAHPTITKALLSSSDSNTAGEKLAIGEVVTYAITVRFTEGVTQNVVITDLGQDNSGAILEILSASVYSVGGNLSNAGGTLVVGLNGVISNAGGSAFNDRAVFNLGNVTNTPDGVVNDGDTMVIYVTARVANDTINQSGDRIQNTASLAYTDGEPDSDDNPVTNQLVTAPVEVEVVEPHVNVRYEVISATTGIDAGDSITYRVTINNLASNGATGPAYDVALRSVLPDGVSLTSISTPTLTGATQVVAVTETGNVVTGTFNIALDGSVTFEITVTVDNTVAPGETLTSDIDVTFTSQSGTVTGERTGSSITDPTDNSAPNANGVTDPLNNYAVGGQVSVTAVNPFSVTKSLNTTSLGNDNSLSVVIGEVLTYRLAISVMEGTTSGISIVDTLDSGLSFVAGSALIYNPVTGMTVGTLVVNQVGQVVTFSIADVVNNGGSGGTTNNAATAETDIFYIDYQVRVANVLGNQEGTELTNTANGSATGVNPDNNNSVTVTVLEPRLTIDKEIISAGTSYVAGDTITYEVVLENTGSRTAYDVNFWDMIPAGLQGDPTSITVVLGGTPPATVNTAALFNVDGSRISGVFTIPSGATVTITYSVDVLSSVLPGQTFLNDANANYSSLPGNIPGERTGADVPDPENNGHPDSTTVVNNYAVGDEETTTASVYTPIVHKSLVSTNNIYTDDSDVAVGEVVTYALRVQLYEGTLQNLVIRDLLPVGMQFLNGSNVLVAYDAGIDTTGGIAAGTYNYSTAIGGFVSSDLAGSLDSYGSGSDVYFHLGTLVNNSGTAGVAEYVTITFSAVVLNVQSNVDGTSLTNSFEVYYDHDNNPSTEVERVSVLVDENGDGTPENPTTPQTGSNLVTVDVVEPNLALVKTTTTTGNDAGDTVVYQLVITNNGTAAAHEIRIQDILDGALELVTPGSALAISSNPGYATLDQTGNDTDSVDTIINRLNAGDSITITITARIVDEVVAGDTIENTASISYSSMPGTPSEERDGSGDPDDPTDPNNYRDESTSSSFVVATPQIDKLTPSDTTYAIGETVAWDIVITLPEGHTNGLVITDYLPAGLVYTNYEIVTLVANSNGVLSTNYSGTIPSVTVTNPTGNQQVFTFNDTVETDADATSGTSGNSFILRVFSRVDNIIENQGAHSHPGHVEGSAVTFNNTASLTYTNGTSGNPTNVVDPTAPDEIEVVEPVLSLLKTVETTGTNLDAGDTVTYKIVISNTGTSTAYNAALTDLIPSGLLVTSIDSVLLNEGTSAATGTASITGAGTGLSGAFTIPVGAIIEITYTVTLQNSVTPGTDYDNTATVTWTSLSDPDDANGRTGDDGTQHGGSVNDYQTGDTAGVSTDTTFELTKSADKSSATIGEIITYTLRVRLNEGTTNGVQIVDVLPSVGGDLQLIYVGNPTITYGTTSGSSISGSVTPVVGSSVGGAANDQLTFNLGTVVIPTNGDATNDYIEITYQVRVANVEDTTAGDTLTNDATGSATGVDPDSDSADVDIVEPSLVIGKSNSDTDNVVSIGETITYTVDLQNVDTATGATAYNVVISDNFVLPGVLSNLANITVTLYDLDGILADTAFVAGTDYTLVMNGFDGWSITLADGLDEGFGVRVSYDATFSTDLDVLTPGLNVDNNTRVSYTSLENSSEPQIREYGPTNPPGTPEAHDQDTDPHEDTDRVTIGTGSLGNRVWFDRNGDGIQQSGEAGIVGATVTLRVQNANGSHYELVVATGANGEYLFEGLAPGAGSTYTVTVTSLAGSTSTDKMDDLTLTPGLVASGAETAISAGGSGTGAARSDIDFGLRGTGSIGDTVYFDVDGDGIQDAGDIGLAGITVTLTWGGVDGDLSTTDDNIVLTTTTDINGNYSFANIFAGNYSIEVDKDELLDVYGISTDPTNGTAHGFGNNLSVGMNAYEFVLAAGESNQAIDFGYQGNRTVDGSSYHDREKDGAFDGDDTGIGNVGIELWWDANNDGIIDAGDTLLASTTTAADGSYDFDHLIKGNYLIREVQPTGFGNGAEGSTNVRDIQIGTSDLSDENFGNTTNSISGSVYYDNDNDGVRDSGEAGLDGIWIDLYWSADGITYGAVPIASTQTDANGDYLFDHENVLNNISGRGDTINGLLAPGFYRVVERTQPTGLLDGKDTAGTEGGTVVGTFSGSDGSDTITQIELEAGADATGYNFGEIAPSSLDGYVYVDLNGNGVFDDDFEPGLIGVTITLTGTNDHGAITPIIVTTDANGYYSFGNLRPGSYTITQTQHADYIDGQETVGSFPAGSSNNAGNNSVNDVFNVVISNTNPAYNEGTGFNFGELFDANPLKEIIGGVSEVAIGDIIRYGLEFDLPYGTVYDAQVWDNFIQSTGLRFAGNVGINLGGATSSLATLGADDVVYGSGTDVWFKLGNLTNASSDGSPVRVRIEFDVLVVDESANISGRELGNDFRLFWDRTGDKTVTDPETPGSDDYVDAAPPVTVEVIEPRLEIGKSVDDSTPDLGQTLDYVLTINHTGASTATAYDLIIRDEIPTGLTLDLASIVLKLNGTVLTGTDLTDLLDANLSSSSGNLLLLRIAELAEGDVLTIEYQATVSEDHSYLGDSLDNNVRIFWDSQAANDQNTVYTEGDFGLPTDGNDRDYGTSGPREAHDETFDPTQDTERVTVNNNVISGTVYRDVDNSGVLSLGDTGIAGVSVTLVGRDLNGNTVNLLAITDSNGRYTFEFVPPSNLDGYVITQVQPSGYIDAWETAGPAFPGAGQAIVDNTPGVNTISTLIIPPQSNTSRDGFNFGEVIGSTISGSVYEDYNNNGVRDAGEEGIEGIAVTLTGTDVYGAVVNITLYTDVDGNYTFEDLRPSNLTGYTITEGSVPGYHDGKENPGSGTSSVNDVISSIVIAQDEDLENHEFGELPPASISGYVYNDANSNGVRDTDELGINNVVIRLIGTDDLGQAVDVVITTNASGYYEFTNLRPGEYSLLQTQPSGYADGQDAIGTGFGTGVSGILGGISRENAHGSASHNGVTKIDTVSGIVIANVGPGNRDGINFNFGETLDIDLSKTIVNTSETFTDESGSGDSTDPRKVAIGEVVRYRIVMEIPEGTLDNVVIADLLPNGLAFVDDGNVFISFVNTGGAGAITSSTLAGLSVLGSASDPLTDQLTSTLISSDLANTTRVFASGNTVYFHLGTVTNLQNDADREYVVIEFNTLVTDVASNVSGANISNNIALYHDYDGNPSTPPISVVELPPGDQPVLEVVEPKLTVTKAHDDSNGVVYAGQFINYTITVSNLSSEGSTSDAFNVALRDQLPPGLQFVAGSLQFSGATPDYLSFDGGAVVAHFDTLELGETTTITFRVQVSTSAVADATIDNNVRVHYESIPGDPDEVNPLDPTDPGTNPDGPDRDYGSGTTPNEDPNPAPSTDDPLQDTERLTIGRGVISDYVWYDMNGDGRQTGEAGIAGVTVELLIEENGTLVLIATQVTDSKGLYAFNNLADGDFIVRIVTDTLPEKGATVPTYDYDGVAGSPHQAAVTLTLPDEVNSDVDFGYRGTGAIGDRVFIDRNRNGTFDGGDTGIGGVTVMLTYIGKNGQNIILTTTTDSSGAYRFDGLLGGNYLITLNPSQIDGKLVPTVDLDGVNTPHQTRVTLAPGQIMMEADFGYQLPSEIIPGFPNEEVSVYYQMVFRPVFGYQDTHPFGYQGAHPFDYWHAPEWRLIDHSPIFASPLLSGHAEPGSSIVLTLYNHRGEMLSTSTILVGSGGNWVANFPGVKVDGPITVESTITASNFTPFRSDNNFNFRTNYLTGVQGGFFQSRYAGVDQAFSELAYERLDAMELGARGGIGLGWKKEDYEFLAASALPGQ